MKLRFPLDLTYDLEKIPAANRWGAVRKFDNHTGVDLFCDPGTPVYAIEDGEVKLRIGMKPISTLVTDHQ